MKYSIRKCKKKLRHVYKWYKKKKKTIPDNEKKNFENILNSLSQSIAKKDKEKSKKLTLELEKLSQKFLKKTALDKFIDAFISITIAIIIAIIIRQTWFENYTIPTGSMRPTLKEKDFLIVSKTSFGINKPTRQGHIYFNPSLIKRGDIVIFTTANMDVENNDYMYFFIIPGKKQFIKRLIAKPGDIIYFYGGKIYGIDKDGKEIKEFKNDKWFTKIEHIPFIRFEGKNLFLDKKQVGIISNLIISQMNTPIAKLTLSASGNYGKLLFNKNPPFPKNFSPSDYFDIWGFKNYATTRIVTKQQVKKFYPDLIYKNAEYYLELTHHPSIKKIILEKDFFGRLKPNLSYYTSLIPLSDKNLTDIFNNLYTCRFTVKNNILKRAGTNNIENYLPKLQIPNGCYEFQKGVAYKVDLLGITKKLKKDHPIYKKENKKIVLLYNLGIEMNTLFSTIEKNQNLRPSRYGYFLNGSLYLMGAPIIKKEDFTLKEFIKNEEKRKKEEASIPFIPEDLEINKEFILKYGLKIPENHYLVLGDNHAMSADSREFGFVPQENLRGRPLFIYWPIGSRFGKIFQPMHQLSSSSIIVSFIVLSCALGWMIYLKKKYSYPLKF